MDEKTRINLQLNDVHLTVKNLMSSVVNMANAQKQATESNL